MTPYLRALRESDQITEGELRVLAPSGVRAPEELYALTLHFGELFAQALPGGNLAKISALAARNTPMAFRNMALASFASPQQVPMGAQQPPNASPPIGANMGLGSVPVQGNTAVPLAPIDHHSSLRAAGWPVRDQGQRGTCVAHAMVACYEHRVATGSRVVDQSEQFLFWGAKQFDPDPDDGTLHAHALAALHHHGSCDEHHWPYVGSPQNGTVHQGPPPASAINAATCHVGGGVVTSSKAGDLYRQLQGGPVSVGVPVFADPNNRQRNNWNIVGLFGRGIVGEPPPYSVVIGGHATCVVGFEPDQTELAGLGWFIIRNSWGTSFGQNLPQVGGAFGPEPGYGQISWAHMDQYLWEQCWL